MRIENKNLWSLPHTGTIDKQVRLRAVPHATLSIEAKMSGGK
jgi:hypothetical protein